MSECLLSMGLPKKKVDGLPLHRQNQRSIDASNEIWMLDLAEKRDAPRLCQMIVKGKMMMRIARRGSHTKAKVRIKRPALMRYPFLRKSRPFVSRYTLQKHAGGCP